MLGLIETLIIALTFFVVIAACLIFGLVMAVIQCGPAMLLQWLPIIAIALIIRHCRKKAKEKEELGIGARRTDTIPKRNRPNDIFIPCKERTLFSKWTTH